MPSWGVIERRPHLRRSCHFCSLTSFNQSQQWWFRESKQEYLFPLTWDNQGLQDYLHKENLLPEVNCLHLESVNVYSSVRGGIELVQAIGLILHPWLHFLQPNHSHYTATHLTSVLGYVRQFTDQYRPPWILWAMFTSGILAALTMALFCPDRTPADTPLAIRYTYMYVLYTTGIFWAVVC